MNIFQQFYQALFLFCLFILKYNYNYLKVILFSILLSSVLLSGFLSSFMFDNNIKIYSNLSKFESVKTESIKYRNS